MSDQCRCCTESVPSTCTRVAARPARSTRSARSRTGSGVTASTAACNRPRSTPASTSVPRNMSPLAPDAGSSQPTVTPGSRSCDGAGIGPARWRERSGRRRRRRRSRCRCCNRHAGCAGVEHRQQGGEPAEAGAVADRGRHGDQRDAGQPADHAGQRALHARDHHQAVEIGQLVGDGEQPVQPGHPDVGDAHRGWIRRRRRWRPPRRRRPDRTCPP